MRRMTYSQKYEDLKAKKSMLMKSHEVEKKENYDEKYEDLKAGKPMLMESP